jgi:hypothetical protein
MIVLLALVLHASLAAWSKLGSTRRPEDPEVLPLCCGPCCSSISWQKDAKRTYPKRQTGSKQLHHFLKLMITYDAYGALDSFSNPFIT